MSDKLGNNQAGGKGPIALQFRLVHVAYAIAVLASALAMFGPLAIPLAVAVIASWGYVFSRRSRPRGLIEACVAALMLSCLVFSLVLPYAGTAREAGRRAQCHNNLKEIALALRNYHDTYGEFPPAYIPDRNGKPMHSWRVLILPFLGEKGLYAKYRFDEPWHGPNNRQLLDQMRSGIYQCPSDPQTANGRRERTSYVAVVGERTVWPGSRSRKMSEISDGLSNTVMVVEYQSSRIAWMEPRDLELDEALHLLTSRDAEAAGVHSTEDLLFKYYWGRQVGLADGSVRFVGHGRKRDYWSALLTIDDGADPYELELVDPRAEFRRLELDNCLRLALFLFLVVLPLPWVWLGRKPIGSPCE